MRDIFLNEIFGIFRKYDNDEYKNSEMESYASEMNATVFCYDARDVRQAANEIVDRLANIFIVGNSLKEKEQNEKQD